MKSTAAPSSTEDNLELWLTAGHGAASADNFIEIRHRVPTGMGQEYLPVRDIERAADRIRHLGQKTDVYVGVASRFQRAGGASAIGHHHLVWVDLDDQEAIDRAEDFPHPPSLVVNSGNGRHLYWVLDAPHESATVVETNRRLAYHLGGDLNCCDAARVMRAPGTFNRKDPDNPRPVTVERVFVETYDPEILAGHLTDPVKPSRQAAPRTIVLDIDDPLLMVTPPEYVTILTGQEIGRDGKINCPFHGPERTPSLHVYPTTDRGWTCFGCQRSGTIYDFASHLYGIGTRGDDFIRLRRRIAAELRQVIA